MESIKTMDYKKIDDQLSQISRKINLLTYLRPINLRQEKEKFFANSNFNPHFRYPNIDLDFNKLKADLSSISPDETPLGLIFKRKCKELLKKITLLENLGKPVLTKLSIDLYGRPGRKLIKKAKDYLVQKPRLFFEGKTHNVQEIKRYFKKMLQSYNLSKKWRIKLKKGLVPDCYVVRSIMYMRPNVKFSKERMRRTAAHEIETHILRRENGKAQPYKIFSEGLANYTSTEEGLAIYNEEQMAERNSKKSFWPALYVVAVDQALVGSFRDVFDTIRGYGFSKERAWVISCKVKRGLADTSKPGSFTKDWLYLAGKCKIDRYLNQGGDLKKLYLGKIGTEDLSLIEKMPGIKEPKYLPKFL